MKQNMQPRPSYWLVPLLWAITVISIAPRFGAEYSPDSYAYYLLGSNLFSGHGYASQAIRDFYMPTNADFYQSSKSFPPLMPIVIGIVDKVFKMGIASGALANIYILLALFYTHFLLAKNLVGKYFLPVFLALPFFIAVSRSRDSFTSQIVSGASTPLAALFCTLILYIISSQSKTKYKSFLLGFCIALLSLTRFDTLIFCALLIGVIKLRKLAHTRWVIGGLLLTMMPWLIRNIIVFGNPLVSDNTMAVVSTYPSIIPICWFDHMPVLRDNLYLWVTQRISNFVFNTETLILLFTPAIACIAIFLSIYGLYLKYISKNIRTYTTITWVWVGSNLGAVSLTPYHSPRYFVLSMFFIGVSALLTVLTLFLKKYKKLETNDHEIIVKTPQSQHIAAGIALILSILIVQYFVVAKIKGKDTNASTYQCIYNEFNNYIEKDALIGSDEAEYTAYYSKWRTIYLPRNLYTPNEVFVSWVLKFKVRYAIVETQPERADMAKHPQAIIIKKACGVQLVDLTRLSNENSGVQK